MRPFYWVILIVVQIWLACQMSILPYNAARVSYRREERAAALIAQAENPSPANRAVLQEELRLAERHVFHRELFHATVWLAVFLALDVVFIYARRHPKREPASA